MNRPFFETNMGKLYLGDCETIISDYLKDNNRKANLLFTSPPFPLCRAKRYGNMKGEEYLEWISSLASLFSEVVADDGSIVIEIGNAWESGYPTHSTLPLETLMRFKERGNLFLCQEFIHYNPSALPSPIEWVNKRRIRVKDSFTRIWWLSKTPNPKADNRRVLTEYSQQMKKLIKKQSYNSGKRPSEHNIGKESFSVDNGGAIPGNVIISANTSAKGKYFSYCKENGLQIHPARMSRDIPAFFIKFLTDENDLVLDPFSGSNITGSTAESLGRNWMSIEVMQEYAEGSKGRFI